MYSYLLKMLASDIQRRSNCAALEAAIMLLILGFTPIEASPVECHTHTCNAIHIHVETE